LGHTAESHSDPLFLQHLWGGSAPGPLRWQKTRAGVPALNLDIKLEAARPILQLRSLQKHSAD
jgi:hypothetical protein